LKRAADPQVACLIRSQASQVLPSKNSRPGIWWKVTGDYIEHGGFTGALGPDEPKGLVLLHCQRTIVHRHQATETLVQVE
jgi:hypothetical protein